MTVDSVRTLVAALGASTAALAALGAALQARAAGEPLPPEVGARVEEVLAALGPRDAVEGLSPGEIRPLLAMIRTELMLGAKLVTARPGGPGWAHAETGILEAAGDVSAGFPVALMTRIAPRLEGLAARLDAADAAFLDIGAGVAALSIEMARLWPRLRVVGIDPWAPSLAIARERVAQAGLAARIELRQQSGEDLPDLDTFDLAWIPSAFIPEQALPRIVERSRRALRPGGWLLFAMLNPAGDPLATALTRLRATLWGGLLATPGEVESLLTRSGLGEVVTLPGPPSSVVVMVAGRRRS